jgi:hypothetical protein
MSRGKVVRLPVRSKACNQRIQTLRILGLAVSDAVAGRETEDLARLARLIRACLQVARERLEKEAAPGRPTATQA